MNEPAVMIPPRSEEKTLSQTVREHLHTYFRSHEGSLPAPGVYDRLMPLVLKPLIEVALEATHGNQIRAAHVLGLNRNTLRKKISELGIDPTMWQGQ